MKYTHLIFDLDNTLLDFKQGEEKALEKTILQFFSAQNRHEAEKNYHEINKSLWDQLEKGEISNPAEINSLRFRTLSERITPLAPWDEIAGYYLGLLGQQTQLMEGVKDYIPTLEGRFNLSILTNGIHRVQINRLKQSFLKDYFPVMLTSEEAGCSKPSPKIFKLMLERLDHPAKENLLMIGDSLKSDIAGARASGIDACWYNPQKILPIEGIRADYEIQDWKGLEAIIGG